ncbi:LysR family transcriptional regulator [Arenibaculum pallidiluteum]|uniref:LysR family transcriptional regulator n=1 Tax=Arenibaculum pallidiluteum TaxID=2812559 RepID=UPI001A9589A6|nr:LysR family transcriptional regulator [Arenibaculum pallidiluteum]
MDLRQLRYFLAVAEHGSILKASQHLRVAQPSISAHLRNLEQELGVVLFERSTRGVVATVEGLELVKHARLILKSADDARESLRSHSESPVGRVVFAIPSSLVAILTVPLIEEVRRRLPNVSLRVVESMTGYIVEWLNDGRVDVGLLYNADHISGVDSVRLLTEELYVGGHDEKSLEGIAVDGEIPFERLEGLPLVLPGREHGLRALVEQTARRLGMHLSIEIEIDAFSQIKQLVRRGVGYTVLSLAALHEDLPDRAIAVARIVHPAVERAVFIAHASNRPLSRASREVERIAIRILQNEARAGWWRARL